MKQRSRIPVVVFLALILAATFWAQSPLITNPANLSQFPSVERIRAATKGTDDVDSHARFMVALWRINGMMIRDLLMAPNGGMYALPAAAAPIQEQYRRALSRYSIDEAPPAIRDPRYRQIEAKYEADPAFLDFLLVQLFSPRFRTEYYAWIRKPVPPSTGASAAAGNKVSSPDPSIAKAKAAKVDLTAFGLTFGEAVSLPECTDQLLKLDTRMCIPGLAPNAAAALDFLNAILPGALEGGTVDPNVMQVRLDEDHCPSWVVPGCDAQILLHDGVLVAIAVSTNGRRVENSVNAELRSKYGPASGVKLGRITPDVGNAFDVRDPEWNLPGLRVEYQVVLHNEEQGVNTSIGWVRVITESAYQRLVNKPVKKKM